MAVVVACRSYALDALGMAYSGAVGRRAAAAPCCPFAEAEGRADHVDSMAAQAGTSSAQRASWVVDFLHVGCCLA